MGSSETADTAKLSPKRRQTRDRLLDAALEAFAERGFHGTSIEDICDRAGFTRGAFYSNFSAKDDLFLALYERQSITVLEAIRRATAGALYERQSTAVPAAIEQAASDTRKGVEETIRRAVDAIPHDRRWFLVSTEFLLHAVREPAAAAALAEHRARLRAGLAEVIRKTARHRLDIEPDELVRALLALHEGGLAQHYIEPGKRAPGALLRGVLPHLLSSAPGDGTA